MLAAWITLSLLLSGASSFMIHNSLHSLCLEDSTTSGPVLLRRCNLDSDLQQWVWRDQRILECVATYRCLSAHHTDHVRTVSCEGQGDGLLWDCDRGRLISLNRSLELSANGKHLTLSHRSKQSQWRSLDEGDICHNSLRSRRASGDPDEFEFELKEEGEGEGEQRAGPAAMTQEQREFLRWFYRTEDPTTWTFAMLALSFACLLVGFLLLGMGSMANKSRKKIAKYKAAAALAQKPESEALQVITEVNDHTDTSSSTPAQARSPTERLVTRQVEGTKQTNGEAEALRPGDIVVTWKDGNVSTLYSEPASEPEEEVREEDGEREEDREREEDGKREEDREREETVEKEEEGEQVEEKEEVVVVEAAAEVELKTGGASKE